MANIYLLEDSTPEVVKRKIVNPEQEYQRFLAAKETCISQLERIMKTAIEDFGQENGEIFDYQLLMLEDKDFLGKIKGYIFTELMNCEYALSVTAQEFVTMFQNIDNEYLRERTADIEDLAKRLNFALRGKELNALSGITGKVVVAASDLSPSQTAGIDRERVKGILLERGGTSCHSVILARSMGIPCIVGVPGLTGKVKHGDLTIINGDTGEITVLPTADQIEEYQKYQEKTVREKQILDQYLNCKSVTLDGFEIKVYANIALENEATAVIEHGGEGVGLLRTEFMYMQSSVPPAEETQYHLYSNIAGVLQERPLIIRTLDAGGDKVVPYLGIPKEENPFLGYRAIRYCLNNPQIFKTQISAILRAGLSGNVSMLLPMIASMDELSHAKAIIGEVKKELDEGGIPYGNRVKLGMMMEIPAAAVMAERFAKEVDFFSVGTNDLTQYLFAADRMNEKVAYLNSYFHPALLQVVKHICDSAAKHGIEVDICGQAGEFPELIPLWAAMGVTNLSVSIPSIPKVRKVICNIEKSKAAVVLERVLSFNTAHEVECYLRES